MLFFDKIKNVWNSIIESVANTAKPKTKTDIDSYDGTAFYDSWKGFIGEQLQRHCDDKVKYEDYDLMDSEVPEISAALDILADFTIYPDNIHKDKMFKVNANNKRINSAIEQINKRTKFPYELYSIIRDTCKYGDNFEEILPDKIRSMIMQVKNIPVESVMINIDNGMVKDTPMIKQLNSAGTVITSLNSDECLHFKLPTDRRRYGNTGKGVSRIEKARLIYRQLRLMEEGLMISRLSRANQNYAIVVDVGDLIGEDVFSFLDNYKKRLQRRKYIDPSTGNFSYKYNPLSVMEDILIPTRQGSGSNVIPLSNNSQGLRDIGDIKYFQDKMIYSINVPKILIGKEEDVNSKATSDVQFISFLRNIRRIQVLIEPEIIKFYTICLNMEGYTNFELSVEWQTIGTIDEERKLKMDVLKSTLASVLGKDLNLVDDYYIYRNIFGMSENEVEDLTTRMDDEEQKWMDEMDSQLIGADDLTDYDKLIGGKEKENTPEVEPTKENVLKYFEDRMKAKEFTSFKQLFDVIYNDKSLRTNVYELIQLIKLSMNEI